MENEEQRYPGKNRRKAHRILGIDFSVPAPWLATIVVLGLVQFGAFWNKFDTLAENVSSLTLALQTATVAASAVASRNEVQDQRLVDHSRRLDQHDAEILDLTKRVASRIPRP